MFIFLWLSLASSLLAISVSQLEQIRLNANPCPISCAEVKTPGAWYHYHDLVALRLCNEPLLLDFNLYANFDSSKAPVTVRACTLGDANSQVNRLVETEYVDPRAKGTLTKRRKTRRGNPSKDTESSAGDVAEGEVHVNGHVVTQTLSVQRSENATKDLDQAVMNLAEYLEHNYSQEGYQVVLTLVRGSLVGLYAGNAFDTRKTSPVFQQLSKEISKAHTRQQRSAQRTMLEVCNNRPSPGEVMGLVADSSGDFIAVQKILKSWSQAKCLETQTEDKVQILEGLKIWQRKTMDVTASEETSIVKAQMADECKYYEVGQGEGCDIIASKNKISVSDIAKFNKKTWGWAGCGAMYPGQRICVGEGNPPMPGSVANAECGPTVPGSAPPKDGEGFENLNPCPLDVCCNVWGKCGINEDFCIVTKSETGNPGTAEPKTNGCVANCGLDIVNNDEGPEEYRKIGYFEGWNFDRKCLHMSVTDIDSSFTHVHFSFAEITTDLQVTIPKNAATQWKKFVGLKNFKAKKILAFGGWAFSNEGTGTGLFRKAVREGSRDIFARRVVDFAIKNELDGLDFDWEYPGATDIEGSDPGQDDDGENYLEFLRLVRARLPKDKSLSIAAPASFWYLKPFPIREMAKVLDYIVYMTYDLHGQWDVGRSWSMPGCPAGNCLRSHVNATQTHSSLVMITKAGVPSHKVVVGVSSYGRSFKMSDSTCRGPQCTFLGERNNSPAKRGRCTDEPGYISDFEINEITTKGGAIKTWYDQVSDSDYLVYDGVEWVGYMTSVTKDRRRKTYRGLNFGGTADWAIDLQKEGQGNNKDEEDDEGNDEKTCKDVQTWQPRSTREPDLYHELEFSPVGPLGNVYFVTIVNLTPYLFRFDKARSNAYQIAVDFGDVPPGRSRQNICRHGTTGSVVDNNADLYYDVIDTSASDKILHSFHVKCTTHEPEKRTIIDLEDWGLGYRELRNPAPGVPATWVITGSENYGYYHSLDWAASGNAAWMREHLDVVGGRTLKKVMVPGSHDAGIHKVSRKLLLGEDYNSQTQTLSLRDQLWAGSRYLDFRVVTGYGNYWMAHINGVLEDLTVGVLGPTLEEAIQDINEFTESNPGEVIVIWMKELGDIDATDPTRRRWSKSRVDEFWKNMEGINNRCLSLKTPLEEQTVEYLSNQNEGKGCVLIVQQGELADDVVKSDPSRGFYEAAHFNRQDNWSDAKKIEDLVAKQTREYLNNPKYLISQWQLTPAAGTATLIQSLGYFATHFSNPSIHTHAIMAMSPSGYPSVLMQDYLGLAVPGARSWGDLSAESKVLALGVNLYLASESCTINRGGHPLFKSSKMKAAQQANHWNGAVFANGTRLDRIPKHWRNPSCTNVWVKGTKFLNGTVIDKDTQNPSCS